MKDHESIQRLVEAIRENDVQTATSLVSEIESINSSDSSFCTWPLLLDRLKSQGNWKLAQRCSGWQHTHLATRRGLGRGEGAIDSVQIASTDSGWQHTFAYGCK